jgi:hypothetical protein
LFLFHIRNDCEKRSRKRAADKKVR